MIEVYPTEDQISKAKFLAEDLGVLKNSITKGVGNIYGMLGEIIVADTLKVERCSTKDYDLIVKGKTIDVKTKHCVHKPYPNFLCSVAAFNIRQKCDYYLFVRILKNLKIAWILGYVSKPTFYQTAKFCKKDELDPESNLGWRFKADCYNLPINKLTNLII